MKSGLYALNDAQQLTVLAALRYYQHDLPHIDVRFRRLSTKDGSTTPLSYEDINRLIDALAGDGLTFGDVVRLVGDDEANPYVAAARQHPLLSEGTLEVDDTTVVSEGDDPGAYVMAWLWVTRKAAGITNNDEDVP